MEFDKDLRSIQEVRDKVAVAKKAQKSLLNCSKAEIKNMLESITISCEANLERLAQMAVNETGFGNVPDKIMKNMLGSRTVYEYIKDMDTIGLISEDKEKGIWEIGVPVGVVGAIIPSTNPTSTTMYKALISLKAGNAVVFSPHPAAVNCIVKTVEIMRESLLSCGADPELLQVIKTPTMDATMALMKHADISLILATGGPGMVKSAYSSGTPAIGVGAGNGPAFIERTANIPKAVKRIIDSKTFDNGTICASEQSIVTEHAIKDSVIAEIKRQNGYMLSPEESKKVAGTLLRANGTMNPAIVGKSAVKIAELAGIKVPPDTKVLVSEQTTAGIENPYSREKLCPVLGFYTEANWQLACERCIEILNIEGIGHTMTIHSQDQSVIKEFALQKPVMRLLVNTPASLGGVGVTTNLAPALTLGCGAVGGTSTSDNISPINLINIRRVAFGARELEDVKEEKPVQRSNLVTNSTINNVSVDVESIVNEVVNRVLGNLK